MRHPIPTIVVLLVALASPARAQDSSPMEALEAQIRAIREAESLDEVIEYVPEYARAQVAQMSEEEKAAALEEWKAEEFDLVREKVAGSEGAILTESDDGVNVMFMTLGDEGWTFSGQTYLMTGVPGARGGFSVSGAVEYELEEGVVSQTGIDGIRVLTVGDALEAGLFERDVPTVQLALPSCVETGTYPLEPRESGTTTVGSLYTHTTGEPAAAGAEEAGEPLEEDGVEEEAFEKDVEGSLVVESVEGDRFTGTFRFSANAADGEAATVEGWLEGARVECYAEDG